MKSWRFAAASAAPVSSDRLRRPGGSAFGLPLLTRELIEQSRRPKTYLLRTVYAVLLFGIAYFQFRESLTQLPHDAFGILGGGREMFAWLMQFGVVAIYLVMPALMCGAIAGERERGTLPLLLITRLSSQTLLLEKLFGRMVPMLSLLLLCMPLAAFFYTFGGVSAGELWSGLWLLLLACLLVGSFSLMISARSRSTVSALWQTYAWGMLLGCTLGCCVWSMSFFPFERSIVIAASVLHLVFTLVFFAAGQSALNNEVLNVQPAENRWSLAAGLHTYQTTSYISQATVALLDDAPVLWRLWHRSARRTVMLPLIVVAETFLIAYLARRNSGPVHDDLGPLWLLGWVLAIPFIVAAASRLLLERSKQTLDVLLATPMRGGDIIRQQMSYVLRQTAMIAVPFLSLVIYAVLWYRNSGLGESEVPIRVGAFLLCWTLSVAIYLPLVAWVSFLIALKSRTQTQAVLLSLGLWFGSIIVSSLLDPARHAWWLVAPVLPPFILMRNSLGLVGYSELLVTFGYYAAVLLLVRSYCLRYADRLLGRSGEPPPLFGRMCSPWFLPGKVLGT